MDTKEIRALAENAFMSADVFMPGAVTINACRSYVASVAPDNVYLGRHDVRPGQVQRILEYYDEHSVLPRAKGIYVNKVLGRYQVSHDGNHRVAAARLLGLGRIRVNVSEPDYASAVQAWRVCNWRGKWYLSEKVSLERGSVNLSYPLHGQEDLALARLKALGFEVLYIKS